MYVGKDEKRPEGQTATEYPVLRLLDHDKFKHYNLVIATDNWYTSIYLALKLLEWDIYLFGTCRTNKVGVPKDKTFSKTGQNKKERGEIGYSKTRVLVKGLEKFIYFISWMDNKPVHLISTFMSKASAVSRVVKQGKEYIGKALINIPTIVMLYNKTMGGTDQFDQQLSYYKTTVKTRRWQVRIFTHFLHCAVVNAHILYKLHHNPTRNDHGFYLLDFTDMLIDQLVGNHNVDDLPSDAEDGTGLRYCGLHAPVVLKSKTLMNNGNEVRTNHRRVCKVCEKLTNYYCKTCNVAVCMGESLDDAEISCFEKYHTR